MVFLKLIRCGGQSVTPHAEDHREMVIHGL